MTIWPTQHPAQNTPLRSKQTKCGEPRGTCALLTVALMDPASCPEVPRVQPGRGSPRWLSASCPSQILDHPQLPGLPNGAEGLGHSVRGTGLAQVTLPVRGHRAPSTATPTASRVERGPPPRALKTPRPTGGRRPGNRGHASSISRGQALGQHVRQRRGPRADPHVGRREG